MKPRYILHIILTLVLLAIGWWLYIGLSGNDKSTLNSVDVATYWFAILVFILFSWLFYWIVHKLSTTVWLIAQVLSIVIAAILTFSLLYISREHQQVLEEEAMLQDENETSEINDSQSESTEEIDTLNLSEDQ